MKIQITWLEDTCYPFFVINKTKDENVKGKNCSPQSLPSFKGVTKG